MKSFSPDVNVWVALAYRGHQQHLLAATWFGQLTSETVGFCRLTQLSFLRLLTHPVVMQEDVKTQREAWEIHDRLVADSRIAFYPERDPDAVEKEFRKLTATGQFAPQQWPDAYLAAFARAEDLILVTFDRALSRLAGDAGVCSSKGRKDHTPRFHRRERLFYRQLCIILSEPKARLRESKQLALHDGDRRLQTGKEDRNL